MKFLRYVGPASLCFAATVSGQEPAKPAAEPKVDAQFKVGGIDPAEMRRQVESLQAQLRKAQEDARAAQRELGQKLRQQAEAARSLTRRAMVIQGPDGKTDRRVITFSIADDASGKAAFVKTFGLDFVEADPVLRSQLDIPSGEGLVVVAVTAGGLADRSGIKEMDLIAKVDLQPVANVVKARELIAKAEKKAAYLDLYRQGKPVHLTMDRPEPPAGSTRYFIGVSVAPVDATLRSHLSSIPADSGLIVTSLDPYGPALKAGIQKNDILIRVDDQPIKTQEALTERVLNSEGKAIKIELLRTGKAQTIALIPMKMASKLPMTGGTLPEALKNLEFNNYLPYGVQINPGGKVELQNGPAAGIIGLSNPMTDGPVDPRLYSGPGDDGRAAARVEAEVKALTAQIDELRRAVGKLTKDRDGEKQASKKED